MGTVNTRNRRHGKKGRFVVDAFGPLIDISKLSVFSSIDNARTLTEDAIADELNDNKNESGRVNWDSNRVQNVVSDALDNWSQNPGLINAPAILRLWHANDNGTEVNIVSTTNNEELFKTAIEAIKEVSCDVSPNAQPADFHSQQLASKEALQSHLEELNKQEERYTVVLHDSYSTDMPVDSHLYDEWYPPATGHLDDLTPILERGLERELRMQPVGWLGDTQDIYLSEFKAFGNFLVFSKTQREELKKQIDRLKNLMADTDKPVVVVLCGPSGSGKSFFVDECVREILNSEHEIVKTDLSSVTDLCAAISQHVTDLRLGDGVGLLDEVDTNVSGEYAYRHLMMPMTGQQVDSLGRSIGPIRQNLWFMAGSIASTRIDWIEQCKDQEPKVVDWSNRVSEWIEIPSVRSNDAILQAIAHLLRCDTKEKIKFVSKTVLLFFALHDWTDARELRRLVKNIYDCHIQQVGDGEAEENLLTEKTVEKAVSHRLDLRKCLAETEYYSEDLSGSIGLYVSRSRV